MKAVSDAEFKAFMAENAVLSAGTTADSKAQDEELGLPHYEWKTTDGNPVKCWIGDEKFFSA